ncbi:hypothetical protein, partial [Mesorhizobium sp. M2E.F.Ca.ET.219.01.1.1]|uniref:hypothetical protein n=1 Tax=Mesorhizobium sp. M2E.F.Ca.ET.219.01.1.1 TaxID=2500530 RepID=UPI00187D5802
GKEQTVQVCVGSVSGVQRLHKRSDTPLGFWTRRGADGALDGRPGRANALFNKFDCLAGHSFQASQLRYPRALFSFG